MLSMLICCALVESAITKGNHSILISSCIAGVDESFVFIKQEQDRFHSQFAIYDDRDSGNEHFFPSGWMGDIVPSSWMTADQKRKLAREVIDSNCSNVSLVGTTCIKFSYPSWLDGDGWAGISWEYPDSREFPGSQPLGPGYDLSRYKKPGETVLLKLSARGTKGGEFAEFSFREVVGKKEIETLSRKEILSERWKEYSIDLSNCALANVTGGLAVVIKKSGKQPAVIYVDDVRIEFGPKGKKCRLNEPHFVRSYVPTKSGEPDVYFRSACFSYDNSLMVLAFCARGLPDDMRRARLICDAFVEVQDRDGFVDRFGRSCRDGRIRNGYSCGDIIDSLRGDVPRLPGWWDGGKGMWFQESYCAGTDSGNMAWVVIALLEFWEKAGRPSTPPYLMAAKRMCEWIHRNTYSTSGLGGYRGGVDQVEKDSDHPDGQKWNPWKSCEHNIDIFVAFERLSRALGDPIWHDRAQHARQFVWRMIDPTDAHLWTGTELDGSTINRRVKPLDANPWALLAFEDTMTFGRSVDAAAKNCLVTVRSAHGDIQGYDFKYNDFKFENAASKDIQDVDEHGIWWEGTAQMQLAFRMLAQKQQADECLRWLRQHSSSTTHKGAVMAAATTKDGLATGFERMDKNKTKWIYWSRPHAGGATCWYIFAELGWNPYWGKPIR